MVLSPAFVIVASGLVVPGDDALDIVVDAVVFLVVIVAIGALVFLVQGSSEALPVADALSSLACCLIYNSSTSYVVDQPQRKRTQVRL